MGKMNNSSCSSVASITAADLVLAVNTSIWTEYIARTTEGAVVVVVKAVLLTVSIRAAAETSAKISRASAFALICQILVGTAVHADLIITAYTAVGAEDVQATQSSST